MVIPRGWDGERWFIIKLQAASVIGVISNRSPRAWPAGQTTRRSPGIKSMAFLMRSGS